MKRAFAMIFLLCLLCGCAAPAKKPAPDAQAELEALKSSEFSSIPGASIGGLFEDFFADAKWETSIDGENVIMDFMGATKYTQDGEVKITFVSSHEGMALKSCAIGDKQYDEAGLTGYFIDIVQDMKRALPEGFEAELPEGWSETETEYAGCSSFTDGTASVNMTAVQLEQAGAATLEEYIALAKENMEGQQDGAKLESGECENPALGKGKRLEADRSEIDGSCIYMEFYEKDGVALTLQAIYPAGDEEYEKTVKEILTSAKPRVAEQNAAE